MKCVCDPGIAGAICTPRCTGVQCPAVPSPGLTTPLSHPLGSDSKVQFDKALSHPGGAFFGLPLIVSATVRGNSSATQFLL